MKKKIQTVNAPEAIGAYSKAVNDGGDPFYRKCV